MAPKTTPSSASTSSVQSLLKSYKENTSSRLKLIDTFLLFLMLSGIIQFVYCVLVTNFPFNAFLSGSVPFLSSTPV
ncbi:DAD family-domain-containing protein [Fomitopsis serialis]|uniref:DAD family-domain-containing protein n=1 Tax=Fomitopsis serialis TaxID=139415 RepID=UPI00200855E6|nr:DAD family-domain-containing protein [Neoantrodia serialis]XP_047901553.1 DAD family-domain-containing protein [Neoantrodia serialis]KAH9918170.1 DAD family-domain-containing protein [Neoantrodia serialis]KAH9938734.1 DAD family-domain-containing protein [Neoantrodia serialis]